MHHCTSTTAAIRQDMQHRASIQAAEFILQHAIPQKEAQPDRDEKCGSCTQCIGSYLQV